MSFCTLHQAPWASPLSHVGAQVHACVSVWCGLTVAPPRLDVCNNHTPFRPPVWLCRDWLRRCIVLTQVPPSSEHPCHGHMNELTVQPGDSSPGIVPNAVCHAHLIMWKACAQLRHTTTPHSNSSVSWGTHARQTQHGPPSPCPMVLGSRDPHHSLQRQLLYAIARMPGRTCMLG